MITLDQRVINAALSSCQAGQQVWLCNGAAHLWIFAARAWHPDDGQRNRCLLRIAVGRLH
ncbi:Uncharacterised protein [Pantoea agglomerans]|uniref:Uncharacterized protein n=1 Tax=Enterobacter agglomerans TaxID=549 RepID=A0A379LS05_ENTAG|nr:Uncharacterised protein [Pantoea agglomerans]